MINPRLTMKTKSLHASRVILSAATAALALGVMPFAFAQAAATPAKPKEDAVLLPQFVITEAPANPYQSRQALSASRIAMDIQDIPQTISVVSSEFIGDSMAARMLDAAKYVTPIVENTLPYGGDRYTIRGFQVSAEFIDGTMLSGADGYSMTQSV